MDNVLLAVFDNEQAAFDARARLLSAGFPPGAVALTGRDVPGSRAFTALTELYYNARFGEAAQLAPLVDLGEARRLAETVVSELKAWRRAA